MKRTPKRKPFGAAVLAVATMSTTSSAPALAQEEIVIDASKVGTPFPHFWEHMFGSCHAPVTLCEDWRNDLRTLKKTVDVQYVRFHGIFDRETGIYAGEDDSGHLLLNFTRVDLIYDGLIKNGVRPFVELSFMPDALADNVAQAIHPFAYHPNVAPPKNPTKWYELVHRFTEHLVERYGIDEVSKWWFEVWNEPNIDFLAGEGDLKQKRYFMMYELAARAIKDVSPRLRVGGPATAQAAWVKEFVQHCVDKSLPVDFVSTHVYPNDEAKNVFGKEIVVTQCDMVAQAVRKVHDEVKGSGKPNLPIIWSEYNAGFDGGQTDQPYVGPWLANTIRQCDGLATEMSYWTFTDAFFEEGGVFRSPFYNGFGLIATGSIPKAPFNAFKVLHLLGDERLRLDSDSALATRRKDGTIVLAVWNYVLPKKAGSNHDFHITLNGSARRHACVHVVDEDHGNPLKLWRAMGKPPFPTPNQQEQLRAAGELPPAEVMALEGEQLSVTVKPNALVVIEFME